MYSKQHRGNPSLKLRSQFLNLLLLNFKRKMLLKKFVSLTVHKTCMAQINVFLNHCVSIKLIKWQIEVKVCLTAVDESGKLKYIGEYMGERECRGISRIYELVGVV